MRTTIAVFCGLCVLGCATTFAATPKVGISLLVDKHGVIEPNAFQDASRQDLIFMDEHPRAKLELFILDERSNQRATDLEVMLPNPWTSELKWTLRNRETGEEIVLSDVRTVSSYIRRDTPPPADDTALHEGETRHAWMELPLLPVGDFELRTELRLPQIGSQPPITTTSYPVRLSVRVGNEDTGIRRTYLRAAADRVAATPSPDRYPRFRELMMELIALEPANASAYERLGDISAGVAPVEETLRYYERALRLTREGLSSAHGTPLPPEMQKYWERCERSLTAFARAMGDYRAAGAGAHIFINNDKDGKRVTVFRADHTIVGTTR